MKPHHIFFLFLKICILVQFGLVLAKKWSFDSKLYILTEVVFKTCLALFIEIFLFHTVIEGMEFEDKVILSFAGGLLFFDAWFNDFPKLRKN